MATQLFNAAIAGGATSAVIPLGLPTNLSRGIGFIVNSSYAVTAATTGVDLQAAYSFDGILFTDFFSLAVPTTPTVSSGTPVSSAKFISVAPPGVTAVQLRLKNLDATNAATTVLQYSDGFDSGF